MFQDRRERLRAHWGQPHPQHRALVAERRAAHLAEVCAEVWMQLICGERRCGRRCECSRLDEVEEARVPQHLAGGRGAVKDGR